MRLSAPFFAIASFVITWPAGAIVNGDPPEPSDHRFDAIGAFSKAEWMGLASPSSANPQDHNWWCDATLIAPDVILTAAHCVAYPVDGRASVGADGSTGESIVIGGDPVGGTFEWDEEEGVYRFMAELTWHGEPLTLELHGEHGEPVLPPNETEDPPPASEEEDPTGSLPGNEGAPSDPTDQGASPLSAAGCACSSTPSSVRWDGGWLALALGALVRRRRSYDRRT